MGDEHISSWEKWMLDAQAQRGAANFGDDNARAQERALGSLNQRIEPPNALDPRSVAMKPSAYDKEMDSMHKRIATLEENLRLSVEQLSERIHAIEKTRADWMMEMANRLSSMQLRLKVLEVLAKRTADAEAVFTTVRTLEPRDGKLEAVEPKAGADVIIELHQLLRAQAAVEADMIERMRPSSMIALVKAAKAVGALWDEGACMPFEVADMLAVLKTFEHAESKEDNA